MKTLIALALIPVTIWAASPIPSFTWNGSTRPASWPNPPEFCSDIKDKLDIGITSAYLGGDGVRHLATRFTAPSNMTVCKIGMKIARTNSSLASVFLAIYSHDATGNGRPGSLLGSASIAFTDIPQITAGSSFNFSSDTDCPETRLRIPPVSLTSGTTYWISEYHQRGSLFDDIYIVPYQVVTNPVAANQSFSADATLPPTTWSDLNDTTRFKYTLYGD